MSNDDDNLVSECEETNAYNLNSWMADLHSSIKHLIVSDLSLPGAHNSGMDKEGNPNAFYDTCQDKSFRDQLNNGVRVLDIRLRWHSGFGNENINQGLIFAHAGTSIRTFANMLNDLDRFQEANPGEIVILDFHHFEAQRADKPVPYALIYAHFMRHYTWKMLPGKAMTLTLEEIRAQYPGPRIIVAAPRLLWTDGTGDGIPARDRTYFWDKLTHNWVGDGEVTVAELKKYIAVTLKEREELVHIFSPWSMSATAYNIMAGPVNMVETLAGWYPVRGEWQRKSNIINFDWCSRSNAIMIKNCIESNILKESMMLPRPVVALPFNESSCVGSRPVIVGTSEVRGATVVFEDAGSFFNYGTAEVREDGVWFGQFYKDIMTSSFRLICYQVLNGKRSAYSPVRTLYVNESGLSMPRDITVNAGPNSARISWSSLEARCDWFQEGQGAPRSTTENFANVEQLKPGQTYTFNVWAVKGLETSETATITYTMAEEQYSVPRDFRVVANANKSVTVAWNAPLDGADQVTGYWLVIPGRPDQVLLTDLHYTMISNVVGWPLVFALRARFSGGGLSDYVRLVVTVID